MKKRILLLSEELGPGGGGKGVAANVLQTLASAYDVTLLCYAPPDCASVDRWCDTNLQKCHWRYLGPTAAEKLLVRMLPDSTRFQRVNVLLNRARGLAPQFDLTFACCSLEADLGRPGIQYLHYPYLGHTDWRSMSPGSAPLPKLAAALLRRKTPPWMAISRFSFERMRRNLTLTNSHWTVTRIRELYDMSSHVLYPPAAGRFRPLPWPQRRDAFVAIGRMEPPKRFDWMIEILTRVRAHAPGLELHICTHLDEVWHEPEANRRVQDLARAAGPWVHLHHNLPREELMSLLAQSRYGLHAKIDEHFGMAPAEMARAGCIPFVHDSGGQIEVVDNDSRVRFGTADDAVAKITTVLRDAALQDDLRARITRHAELFTPEAFSRGLIAHVENFLAHGAPQAGKEFV